MTEIEAISKIQWRIDTASAIAGKGTDGKAFEDLEMAIQALEEIQQYRAIGTVDECKLNKVLSDKRFEYFFDGIDLLEEYRVIGTIEEFKALKEKSEPKELAEHNFQDEVHHYLCPSCRSIVSCNQNYCDECGQSLET